MPTLSDKMILGAQLFGEPARVGELRTYGTATADSSGGAVSVDVGGEVATIPTVGAVTQGDEVLIQVQDGHPVAIGVKGWGDEVQSAIDDYGVTLSYVWLDQYGRLRVTPEPQDQNPVNGVTIDSDSVDVIGSTYAATVDEHGLLLKIAGTTTDELRVNCENGGVLAFPSIVSKDGLLIASTSQNDLSSATQDYTSIEMEWAAFVSDGELVRVTYEGVPYCTIYQNRVNFGGAGSADVYPVATASRLGPVMAGSGLSVNASGVLSSTAGAWRSVSCTSSAPSGFNTRQFVCWANDTARLVYFNLYFENTGGTNTSVPANTNLLYSTDSSLYPTNLPGAPAARIGSGTRYGGALMDWPVRMIQQNANQRYWCLRSPTWAFSASSFAYEAMVPYDFLGIV